MTRDQKFWVVVAAVVVVVVATCCIISSVGLEALEAIPFGGDDD